MSYGEITEVNGIQYRTVEYIVRNFAFELPEVPIMRKKKKEARRAPASLWFAGGKP